jgi:alkylation response protein AidB-like acyl-CoA dehydrogenase
VELAPVAAHLLEVGTSATLDPDRAVRQVRCTIPAPPSTALTPTGDWSAAVAAARVALAHQLIAAARTMLDQARTHAVDRAQFGRPVASFQAVRHRLADSLVAIEGAAAVAAACTDQPGPAAIDPLLAATAKSLAGEAAQVTADHAQQVLAGIGFTTDHPYQRWMKRVLTIDTLFGSASSLPGEIGAELLRRGRAPRLVEL